MSTETDRAELNRLLDQVDELARKITSGTRVTAGRRPYIPNLTPWESQEAKDSAWPAAWFPFESMCDAVQDGDGSGEGNPGYQACTRPAGHRDIRTGDNRDHLWGPCRYSESRARSAAMRMATENFELAKAALGVSL
ncbi:hypothetical protein SAMN05444157_1605 [Frankineae bacterium MT45]|nr:hypothetical protein SAMN05444157_1605 [Frankineae bacterium MT45]